LGLDYVQTQESTTGEDTIKVKTAFEHFASRHHVKVKHYHCGNGIFSGKKFRAAGSQGSQSNDHLLIVEYMLTIKTGSPKDASGTSLIRHKQCFQSSSQEPLCH
jgi:hypothetical protein